MSEADATLEPTVERIAARLRARSHGRHSGAYRWMYENHEAVLQMLVAHKPTWAAVAEELARAGVRGGRGQVVAANDLRKIWNRVCRDIDVAVAERRTGVPARKPQPRDMPANWRPTPLAAGTPKAPETAQSAGESSFAAVRREMEQRSGR